MKERKRVLIFADNANRDLLATRLVQRALQRRGVETGLYTQNNITVGFRKMRPHAVVCNRGNLPFAKTAAQYCKVYVVPSEGAQLTPETMLSVFMGRGYFKLDSVEWISRCYLWSENVRHWLLQTGMFRPDQLLVTGNCRLDVYRNLKRPAANRKFTLGVAFSAKGVSAYYGHPHYAETYFDFHPDLVFPVAAPGRHYEDIVWRDHAILRRMMRYLRRFIEQTDGEIILRPGPLEDHREFLFLQKRFPDRVRVKLNQPMIEFLSEIDTLLTCWSTTGLEALVMGVPVVSLAGAIDQEHLFAHIDGKAGGFDVFVPFYHLPKTEDELFDMLKLAAQHRLTVSPRSDNEVAALLKEIYDWPYAQAASDRIGEDLVNDLKDAKETPRSEWAKAFPIRYGIPMPFAPAAYWAGTLLYFLKKGAFKPMRSFFRTKDPHIEALIRRMEANEV